jgi:hypothetical protein
VTGRIHPTRRFHRVHPGNPAIAAVVLGVCLLAVATTVRYTAPQWWYLLWLSGFGTLAAAGLAGAQVRWRPWHVFRITTDGKDRIELTAPRNARHHFVEGEDAEPGGDRRSSGRFDLASLLVGRRVSGVSLTVAVGVCAVGCAWLLLLWYHPLHLGLATSSPPGAAFTLAGAGTVAVAFRANRGLLPTTVPPLAVGVAVRHYNCHTLSVFYGFHVDCIPPDDPRVVLGVAAALWVLGLGTAVVLEGVTFVANHLRERSSDAGAGRQ